MLRSLAVLFSMGLGVLANSPRARPPSPPPHQAAVLEDDDTMGTDACLKKRVDRCGCHRVFGRRHCHPNRRREWCDAYALGQEGGEDYMRHGVAGL